MSTRNRQAHHRRLEPATTYTARRTPTSATQAYRIRICQMSAAWVVARCAPPASDASQPRRSDTMAQRARWTPHGRRSPARDRWGGRQPRILKFYREVGHPDAAHDEVAWCAARSSPVSSGAASRARPIADGALRLAGARSSRASPAIAVSRGDDPAAGHVASTRRRCCPRLRARQQSGRRGERHRHRPRPTSRAAVADRGPDAGCRTGTGPTARRRNHAGCIKVRCRPGTRPGDGGWMDRGSI
jgi:hypothetical protein